MTNLTQPVAHQDIVKQIETILEEQHSPSPNYTAPAQCGNG